MQRGIGRFRSGHFAASGPTVYPAKNGTYSQNFNAVADGILRNFTADGWSAINSTNATTTERDGYTIASGAVTHPNANNDFATRPGKFIVVRDAGSTDHIFETKMTTMPTSGSHFVIVVAATHESNCAFLESTNSSGTMGTVILQKNVGGTLTQLGSYVLTNTALKRNLQAGDVFRIKVIGQAAHIYINGIRITPDGGVSLDSGAAFTKGSNVGFGTRSSVGVVFDDVHSAPMTAHIEHAATSLTWASLASDGTQNVAGSFPVFWPGTVAAGRKVPLAFTYTGTVSDLDYRVVNGSTGALVQDWQRVATADRTLSAGTGTANVQVPMCVNASNPTVRIELRAANDVDAADMTPVTTVGRVMAFYGQSNSAFRGGGSFGTFTAFDYSNAYMWWGSQKVWSGGAGTASPNQALMVSRVLADATGYPWGVYIGGIGSQSIDRLIGDDGVYSNSAGTGSGYWDDFTIDTQAKQCNAYGFFEYAEWTQGENESGTTSLLDQATETADYRGKFYGNTTSLLGRLRGGAMISSSAPVGVCIIGSYAVSPPPSTTDAIADANWSLMRQVLFGLSDMPNTRVSSSLMDLAHDTGGDIHFAAESYKEANRRTGLTAAKALGYIAYDGRGPIVTSVTRAGAVITLNLNANGATGFDQTAAGNLDAYDVYLASDASSTPTLLTKSSTVLDAANSKITITLAADPGAAVKVRSFWGHWPEKFKTATPAVNGSDITAIRARGTYSDGTTIPVEPIYTAITSN